MKFTQRDFARNAARAAEACTVFYFCGPDEAGASAAAEKVAALLSDAGERVEIAGGDLRRDPVLLGDEARSTSLFGDTRHLWVRTSGDEAHDAVKTLIEGEGEACPIFIVAGSASDKSRIAKLLAPRKDAMVAMFYPPDLASLSADIRRLGDEQGLTIEGRLAERIALGAGMDVRLAAAEIAKFALYLGAEPTAPRKLSAEDLEAIGAPTEDDGFAPLVDAVLGGDAARLGPELQRMKEVRINPVGLLLALERRAAQLVALAAKLGRGGAVDPLVEAESKARRIFFRDAPAIKQQLRIWRGARLERLVERLMAMHCTLLRDHAASDLRLRQELSEITRVASNYR